MTTGPLLRSALDKAGWDGFSGWALHQGGNAGQPLRLEVLANGRLLFEVKADQFRADLLSLGWGQGRHGFSFRLGRASFDVGVVSVDVRDPATGASVARCPITLVNDAPALPPDVVAAVDALIDATLRDPTHAGFALQARFLVDRLERLLRLAPSSPCSPADPVTPLPHEAALEVAARVRALAGVGPLSLPCSADPLVTVVIPARDNFALTDACLRSIAAHAPAAPIAVTLVDDHSTDRTMLLPVLAEGLRVVRNAVPMGFVDSVAAGVAGTSSAFILLLNNDTLVRPGWLDSLLRTMALHPGAGIVGAKLLEPDGALQECGSLVWRMGEACNIGGGDDPARPEYDFVRDVDYVSGAALLIRRAVWDQVGGLSPEYRPGYYEDTDLCFKVRAAGHRVLVQPAAEVVHHRGATAGRDDAPGEMKRRQPVNQRTFHARWHAALATHPPAGTQDAYEAAFRGARRHALFIDSVTPEPDVDAGSNAAVQHMLSLMRLGYAVHFVPAEDLLHRPERTRFLQDLGIHCHYRPFAASVDDVLRRHAGWFSAAYVHRVANTRSSTWCGRPTPVARSCMGSRTCTTCGCSARPRPGRRWTRGWSGACSSWNGMRPAPRTLPWSIPPWNAAWVAASVPEARVLVAPWVVAVRPPPPGFGRRSGVVFVGSAHPPNIDAAIWLLSEIMPEVWLDEPDCHLVLLGRHTEDAELRRCHGRIPASLRGRVTLAGWKQDLGPDLLAARLSVAPLRYGAGVKGKVLDSLAYGIPCVMTACAAEGMDLPRSVRHVAETASGIAGLICRLRTGREVNQRASLRGQAWVRQACSPGVVDAALAAAIGACGPPAVRPRSTMPS